MDAMVASILAVVITDTCKLCLRGLRAWWKSWNESPVIPLGVF